MHVHIIPTCPNLVDHDNWATPTMSSLPWSPWAPPFNDHYNHVHCPSTANLNMSMSCIFQKWAATSAMATTTCFLILNLNAQPFFSPYPPSHFTFFSLTNHACCMNFMQGDCSGWFLRWEQGWGWWWWQFQECHLSMSCIIYCSSAWARCCKDS